MLELSCIHIRTGGLECLVVDYHRDARSFGFLSRGNMAAFDDSGSPICRYETPHNVRLPITVVEIGADKTVVRETLANPVEASA